MFTRITYLHTCFSNSHVRMWELDHNKGWVLKDWCFQTVVMEKTFESLLDSKEIKPVNPKGNQHWIVIGRIDAEAEAPIFRPSDEKSWLIGKDSDDGKDWRQEKKRMTEGEMVGWHHRLNGHEEQALGVYDGHGSLVCCSPQGHKMSDTTDWLNWTETPCKMPGWMKHKLESKLLGKVSITSDMQMTPPFWQKAKN